MKHIPYWLINQTVQVQNKRDWTKLPQSFEYDQVKRLRNNAIEHLRVLDSVGTIKERVALARASTFNDILKILDPEETCTVQSKC